MTRNKSLKNVIYGIAASLTIRSTVIDWDGVVSVMGLLITVCLLIHQPFARQEWTLG